MAKKVQKKVFGTLKPTPVVLAKTPKTPKMTTPKGATKKPKKV